MAKGTTVFFASGNIKLPFFVGEFSTIAEDLFQLTAKKIKKPLVILPCTLYDLSMVEKKADLALDYSDIDICTTDGMPLVWWFRWQTKRSIERVYGPDLLADFLMRSEKSKDKQLILCSSDEIVRRLEMLPQLQRFFSKKALDLEVIGDSNDPSERRRISKIITKCKPKRVWIGIGSPNQVRLATYLKKTSAYPCTYFCVGAAIPFLAGLIPQAPRWMQQSGLEWLYRLIAEPGRLWHRYLVMTPWFIFQQAWKTFEPAHRAKGDQ
jgi:N-acetylglucosaminyldiphosphoundecaprenol N-acetyl-beta-D-mannosaminyltransferase